MSLFSDLLARHPLRPGRWPDEDLLTELTAAVLRRVPGLAGSMAGFLASSSEPPLEAVATTQEPAGDQGRVDLQLLAMGELRVWAEIKDGAGESGDQILHYLEAMESDDGDEQRRLVYINRLGGKAPSVPAVRGVRWQDVGSHVESWLAGHRSQIDAWQQWLVEEYLAYLKERGLAVSDPVRPDIQEAVRSFQAARDALTRLHAVVREAIDPKWVPVDARWANATGGKQPSDWPTQWWSVYHPVPSDSYAGCDFHFNLLGADPRENAIPVFHAGLIHRPERGLPNPISDHDWRQRVAAIDPADGFGRFGARPDQQDHRLERMLPLSDLPDASLNDQAARLADLINSTFQLLEEHAPDPPA